MQLGIELRAVALYLGHAKLRESCHEAVVDHLNALLIVLVSAFSLERSLEIIHDRQEVRNYVGNDIRTKLHLFLCGALSVVVVFSHRPEKLILYLSKLLCELFVCVRLFFDYLCVCGFLHGRFFSLGGLLQILAIAVLHCP